MPETYKVAAIDIQPRRPWESKHGGRFISYYVSVLGDQTMYEVVRKAESPAPSVGEEIFATVETREHNGNTYYKLKKVQQQGGFGGGFKADPKKDARITRQHSQEMSLRTLELAHKLGVPLPKCGKVGELVVLVRTVAALYDSDAYATGEKA